MSRAPAIPKKRYKNKAEKDRKGVAAKRCKRADYAMEASYKEPRKKK